MWSSSVGIDASRIDSGLSSFVSIGDVQARVHAQPVPGSGTVLLIISEDKAFTSRRSIQNLTALALVWRPHGSSLPFRRMDESQYLENEPLRLGAVSKDAIEVALEGCPEDACIEVSFDDDLHHLLAKKEKGLIYARQKADAGEADNIFFWSAPKSSGHRVLVFSGSSERRKDSGAQLLSFRLILPHISVVILDAAGGEMLVANATNSLVR